MTTIDLNADLGEGMGTDEDLLDIVSSASIACGGHAGDAPTIRHILKICKARGVRAGAHPGYADPKRFGRFRVVMPLDQLLGQIRSQLFLVRFIADEVGVPLSYVKLHGALANQTAEELAFAVGIFATIQAMDPKMAVLALDNSQQVRAAKLPSTMPIIVISAGLAEEGDLPRRQALQKKLSLATARGRHIIAERSRHFVQLTEPEIVISAVQDLLKEVRSTKN